MNAAVVLALVVGAVLLLGWYRGQPPQARKQALMTLVLVGGGAVLLFALLTGRLNPLVALVVAAIPIIQRLLTAKRVFDYVKSAGGPSRGQRSKLTTRFLDMTLDHDTGDMDGTVREGRFQDERLSALALERLLELLAECRAEDAQSAQVLEAYLDRLHGDAWRERDAGPRASARPHEDEAMSEHEAREILGVEEDASREDIIAAHRRLMQRLHPDRGGSTYLAAKVNAAKELLLARH